MVRELVRVGIVTGISAAAGTCRVKLVDVDDEVSYDLPVVYRKTLRDKDYWMPDIGEHVVCLFLGQGLEQGFVLGAIYSDADGVPVASADKWHKTFDDGTALEYDRAAHKLTADVQGDIDVRASGRCDLDVQDEIVIKRATSIVFQAPAISFSNLEGGASAGTFTGNFNFIGDINGTGNITATGTIIDGSGNTNHHSHP